MYRPELDGIRAVAVIGVMAFHTFPDTFPGGFLGVDVFFVLSGYLITQRIWEDQARGTYSLARFYERRLKRLVAPLLLTVLGALTAGAFFLIPGDFEGVARSALWTLGFAANFYFGANTGYFDAPSGALPLLHAWSLGVEEQFYLAWPLLLLVTGRASMSPRLQKGAMAILAFLSLVYWASVRQPDTAFYSPLARAWELLLGALVVPTSRPTPHRWDGHVSVIGLLLILLSYLAVDGASPERIRGLLPAFGSAAIVLCIEGTRLASVLSAGFFVSVGRVSYALYLFHWPLLVFSRHYLDEPGKLPGAWLFAITVAAAVLAGLSWRLVEQPLRWSPPSARRTFTYALGATGLAAGLAAALVAAHGFPSRFSPRARGLVGREAMWAWTCPREIAEPGLSKDPLCSIGADWSVANTRGVLWGDSHAEHLAPLLDDLARATGASFLLIRSCPAFIDGRRVLRWHSRIPDYSERCLASQARIIEFLEARREITVVALAGSWAQLPAVLSDGDAPASSRTGLSLMRLGFESLLARIEAPRRSVTLVGDVPGSLRDPVPCAAQALGAPIWRKCDLNDVAADSRELLLRHAPTDALLRSVAEGGPGRLFIPTTERMCTGGRCRVLIDGEFIYRDSSHIRRNLPPRVRTELSKLIGLSDIFGAASPTVVFAPRPAPPSRK